MILEGPAYPCETPDAPTLVVLHGYLGSSRNWIAAARRLAKNITVHTLDLRNHGASPRADSMTHAEMATDVCETLADRRLNRPWLLGHSLGGKVAMRVAVAAPEPLAGLIVEDIAPRAYPPHHQRDLEALLSLPLRELTSRKDADARLAETVPDWAHRQFLLTHLKRTPEGWAWATPLRTLYRCQDQLRAAPLADAERYDGPCAFVYGGQSSFFADGDAPLVAQHFPRASLHRFANCGHNLHMDDADGFCAWVTDWIASRA